jgi:hypothetical protein
MSASYLPSYAFKRFCSGHTALNKRSEYPKDIRNMYFETKKYENLMNRLLDMKTTRSGYTKGNQVNDDERYKLG